jgi:hypothetical protein
MDLFKIWAKLRDYTLEIRNPMTKFKSYKNLGTKYDFSFKNINYFLGSNATRIS